MASGTQPVRVDMELLLLSPRDTVIITGSQARAKRGSNEAYGSANRMSPAASGTDTADVATKDAASPAPEGALHRVMNHLLTSSRSAKDKLDRVHQENLTWIFNAVYDAKNRVAGQPIDGSKQRQHAKLDAEAPKAATEGASCAEGLQLDETVAQHEAVEATQLQQEEQPEAVRVHLTRKRKHAATDCNPVSNQATASVGAPQAKKRLVPSEMRVADLRPELRKRGLPSGGRKVELVARLEQALAQEDVAGEIEKDLEEIREEDEMEVEEEAGEHSPQNNREPLELRKPHATNDIAAAPTPGTQVVVKGDAKGHARHAGGKHEDSMMKQDAPESSEAQAPAADSTTIERPQSVATTSTAEESSASLKKSRSRGEEGEKPASASPVAVNGDPTALKSPVSAKGDEVAPASPPGAKTSSPASAEPDHAPDDAQHASGAPLEEHGASSKVSDFTTVDTALDGPNDSATAVAPAAEGVSPSTTATAGVAVASKSSGVDSQATTEPAAPASSTTMPEASIAVSRVPVAASEVELGPEAEPPAAAPAMSYLDRLRLASIKQQQDSATTTASTATEGFKPAPARLRRGSIVGPGLAAPPAPIRSAAPVSAPAVATNSGATNHSSSFSSSSSQSAPQESSTSSTTTAANARAGPTTTVAPARAVSPPAADTSKTAAPAPSSASTAAASSVNKPTNLLGGLHSFTSLLKGSKPAASEQNSKQPVKIKALERAEEKRRLDQAKEEERRQRKAMLEQKKADATRMQKEAEKKRAAIAAKRKEREEQKGNAGKQANNDASARAPEEKRPRLEQAPKKPEDAKSRPAPSRPEDAVKKIAADQETMPKSAQSSAARAAAPNHATSSNGQSPSNTRQAGAARTGAPVLNKTTTTAAAASSHKPAIALKDISNTANHTAANLQKPGADIVKPSAHIPSSMSGKLAAAAASSHASAPQDNYEISDREDSSDDDCESDDGRKEAKRVPEWAKGPALKEALERQFHQQTRVDPDALFSEQIKTCNLDAIFSSFNAQAKKSRNYRTRQSTGNWKRDELTSAEKTRYRREMGF